MIQTSLPKSSMNKQIGDEILERLSIMKTKMQGVCTCVKFLQLSF